MDVGLRDRVVVITGASRGLGSAFAEHFSREGARLGLLARDEDSLKAIAGQLPVEVVAVKCDVTNEDNVICAFAEIAEKFGRIDSVVANAGGQSTVQKAENLPVDAWREIIDLNLTGSYITARSAYSYLRDSGSGRIVFISSGILKVPQPGSSAYISSKAALGGLTKSLCIEWAASNICVNSVMPGLVDCGGGLAIEEKVRNRVIDNCAFRRFGKSSDIANMVLYLSSGACEFITGEIFSVDGGLGLR